MIIRKAIIDDAESIAKNNVVLANESESQKISYETTLNGVKSLINNPNRGFYIVAENNSNIIGQLMITFEWSDWQNKNIWWLQSIYVKDIFRYKGVFKKLLQQIKKLALENDVSLLRLYVFKENKSAINVYKKLGFKKSFYHFFENKI
jgi:ribosomal protein S18 acetylase RimI-like enzyme